MWDEEPTKRTLGIRERQILWERANHKCEACGKELDFTEMQVGHKTAASRGGSATLRNCVCLCYRCNKLQGTDAWNVFLKKMGKKSESSKTIDILKNMPLQELKFLATKHNIRVKGRTVGGFFGDSRRPPSKRQYINALSKLSENEIRSRLKELPTPTKKKKKRRSSWSLW
jgi:hypothetical protein